MWKVEIDLFYWSVLSVIIKDDIQGNIFMWPLGSKNICTTKELLKLHLRAAQYDANKVDDGEGEVDKIKHWSSL